MPVNKEKCPPPPGGYVFSQTGTIFELYKDIMETNMLTKFLAYLTINVASSFTLKSHIRKNALLTVGHVFQPTVNINELVQDMIGTKAITKAHHEYIVLR
ncbi:hypothetical protein DPMN_009237 [Dreissena polymorpha]|uniref:Uncharacterized protein n=1 Tax=Dreissena polymorpha TaxID=45954 RepID=A0A9D4N0W3_DREPO|nr:hypothetical protein DPMN_009237 [Dreissena polymorpha]